MPMNTGSKMDSDGPTGTPGPAVLAMVLTAEAPIG
jgi:hypothetical protein